MLSPQQRDRLRGAFREGALQVQSMNLEGRLEWKPITAVHRNEVPWETVYEFRTMEDQPFVVTGGHRVYVGIQSTREAETLAVGTTVFGVTPHSSKQGQPVGIQSKKQVPSRQFMYDLTVADNHNLVLQQSGIIVHNCPDRNYHFRPPEHEADIGAYNRVFGYVWEDYELLTYLKQAVDWWDMFPPSTHVGTLDRLSIENPTWRTAIQYGGMMFALMALAINWVHEEFDYSIGGVSLSLEKSSKYESLKSNAEGQFDKGTEAKARTVKYIRGLQQPRYGIGIRSAFGPNVGRGILSPRNFLTGLLSLGASGGLLAEVLNHANQLSSLLS